MWIFGYGSLIWKVDFPYAERVPGLIKGYVRRFWQGSHDHRGVPSAPGRVVTLVPFDEWRDMKDDTMSKELNDCVTWGMVYRIADEDVEAVKSHLDYREKDGYSIRLIDVYASLDDEVPVVRNATCYLGTTHNTSFLGYAPLEQIASQIANSVGPSGPNSEYLIRLAEATRMLAPQAQDEHLFELERRIRAKCVGREVIQENEKMREAVEERHMDTCCDVVEESEDNRVIE